MSSMRNAVQRRNHRERGQLQGREKWGILEKHKDYSLRAKDYSQKKQKIKRLEEKVRDRNPDEFAFGMMSSHSGAKGKHGTGMR
ncbi:small-subunit processome, partial [Aspergillus venezuelensis]